MLTPRFWQMTPAALADVVEMHRVREGLKWERAAWMVHHIMSAFIGSAKAPTPDKLLGRTREL